MIPARGPQTVLFVVDLCCAIFCCLGLGLGQASAGKSRQVQVGGDGGVGRVGGVGGVRGVGGFGGVGGVWNKKAVAS